MTAWKGSRVVFLSSLLLFAFSDVVSNKYVSAFFLGQASRHRPRQHQEFGRDQVILGARKVAVEQIDPKTGKVIQSFKSAAEASRQTGISDSGIGQVLIGRRKLAGNFLWRRQDDKSTPEQLLESIRPKPFSKEPVPLEQLDPISGEVVQCFDSMSEASRRTGIDRGYIRDALNGKIRHAGKFLWRRQGDKYIPELFKSAEEILEFCGKTGTPVDQLDPLTGDVIQSFSTIWEASQQTGVTMASISNAVDGKRKHAGKFLWRKRGDQSSTVELFESPPTSNSKAIPVEQLDPMTGEVIQSFKSATEAQRLTGIGASGIRHVLNGRSRHAGCFLWRRQGDPTIPELFESPPTPRNSGRVVPIEQLDPLSGKVIRRFESITQASRETGVTYGCICTALNGYHIHAGTFEWRRKYDANSLKLLESPSTQDKGRVPVPVEQLDPYSGQVIQCFESIEEASLRTKLPSSYIQKVLSGKRRHAGYYLWRRQGDETAPHIFERVTPPSEIFPVEQLHPVTGKVIQSFESIAEAARRTGIAPSVIRYAAIGKLRHAGTYLWRRKGD